MKSIVDGLRLPLAALLLVLCGCGTVPPPQRGGSASVALGGPGKVPLASSAVLAQGDNAAAPSQQTLERTETHQTAVPVAIVKITETPTPAGIVRVTEQFASPAVLTHTTTERSGTTLGAAQAQKDTGREIAASLAGMRPVQFAGIGFLAFALACFHPGLRLVIGGGKTVPALAGVLGVGLVFGPQVFAGRETVALTAGLGVLLLAFLIVRLSHKEGQLDAGRSAAIRVNPTAGTAKKSR